jgi:16S rRNA (cytosine1402-N4)-methyltransferase
MQLDDPLRGFSYKGVGPLDMRMDPGRGASASELLERVSESELAELLDENADEPHAALIAGLLKQQPLATTHEAERVVRVGLTNAKPDLSKAAVKMSVRRTFQALRIAVNDEFAALDALLRALPACLAPGGRVVMLTFHSGEDRRVKKAFQTGQRTGLFDGVARAVVRSSMTETRDNRRSTAAKLRWAVRAGRPAGGVH